MNIKYPTCDRSFKNKESMPEADINPKVVSTDDESDSSFDQEEITPPRPRPSLKDVIANGS